MEIEQYSLNQTGLVNAALSGGVPPAVIIAALETTKHSVIHIMMQKQAEQKIQIVRRPDPFGSSNQPK